MTSQLSIYDIPEREDNTEKLTYRQERLHKYLIDYYRTYESEPSNEEILNDLDELYGYTEEIERKKEQRRRIVFNDLTCRRNLTFDKDKLAFELGTNYIFTGGGYTDKEWQAKRRIHQLSVEGKKAFKKMAICQLKLKQQNQLVYNFDKFEIQQIETRIRELDTEIERELELIKKLEKGERHETTTRHEV